MVSAPNPQLYCECVRGIGECRNMGACCSQMLAALRAGRCRWHPPPPFLAWGSYVRLILSVIRFFVMGHEGNAMWRALVWLWIRLCWTTECIARELIQGRVEFSGGPLNATRLQSVSLNGRSCINFCVGTLMDNELITVDELQDFQEKISKVLISVMTAEYYFCSRKDAGTVRYDRFSRRPRQTVLRKLSKVVIFEPSSFKLV